MNVKLDHLLYGSVDLEAGIAAIEAGSGVRAAHGGRHPEFGTCNALLSFDDGLYFEILAPDPDASGTPTSDEFVNLLGPPGLLTFAVACDDLPRLKADLARLGVESGDPIPGERLTEGGELLQWSMLHTAAHEFGLAMPFFLDWGTTPHPSTSNPRMGRLESFTVRSPQAEALNRVFTEIGLAVPVTHADAIGFTAEIQTPRGRVVLN